MLDLSELQAALSQGEATITVPAEAQNEDLAAIASCIKGVKDITLDLSGTAITVIGSGVFAQCNALKTVILPRTLKTIGNWAFWWCESLTSVTIPAGVTSIGDGAFSECENLTFVTFRRRQDWYLDEALTQSVEARQLASWVKAGAALYNKGKWDASGGGATVLPLPSSRGSQASAVVRSGGAKTLADKDEFVIKQGILLCYTGNAQKVAIPAGVKTIKARAFSNCYSLTSVTISGSVTSIEASAFSGCACLISVTFARTGGWYLDEALAQRVGAGELASRLKAGAALYNKDR